MKPRAPPPNLSRIVRRDRLVPLQAGDALALRDGRPVINTRSKRAAVVLPAPSRMFEDGGVEARVRLVRPAAREPMAAEETCRLELGGCARG